VTICERCGDYFTTENKKLNLLTICHQCHHELLLEIVQTKWNIENERNKMMDRLREDDKLCFG
jgi:hypothetical protein